jgi:hypothetical protein
MAGFESKLNMLAGGRQGGRDTPKLWNVLLFLILKDQVKEWEETDLVWSLQPRKELAPSGRSDHFRKQQVGLGNEANRPAEDSAKPPSGH